MEKLKNKSVYILVTLSVISIILLCYLIKLEYINETFHNSNMVGKTQELQNDTNHLVVLGVSMNDNIINFSNKLERLSVLSCSETEINLKGIVYNVNNAKVKIRSIDDKVSVVKYTLVDEKTAVLSKTFNLIDSDVRKMYNEPTNTYITSFSICYQWRLKQGIITIGISYNNSIVGVLYTDYINSNITNDTYDSKIIGDYNNVIETINDKW